VLALLLSGGSLLLAGAGWIQVLGWPRWVPGDRGKGKLKQLEHRLEENRRTMKTDFRSLVEARLGEYHKELETKVVSPLRRGQQELSQRLNQSRQKDNETAELWGRISYLESRIASLAHERNQQPAGGSAPSPAENPPEGPMPQQQSEPPPAPPPPADPNLDDAVGALNRSDKAGLRALVKAELNITTTSEEALQKGNVGLPTELCPVSGGGSYLLIERGGRHWLLPTVQTLAGFSSSQPQKGLFDYERDTVMVAELSRAAEVRCSGDTWEVIRRGQVIVPI
jgi:hypothetical protein